MDNILYSRGTQLGDLGIDIEIGVVQDNGTTSTS